MGKMQLEIRDCAPKLHFTLHLNFFMFIRREVHMLSKQTLMPLVCSAAQSSVQAPFSRILNKHQKLVVGKCHDVCRARVRTCWKPARRTGRDRHSGRAAGACTRTASRRCCGDRRGCEDPAQCCCQALVPGQHGRVGRFQPLGQAARLCVVRLALVGTHLLENGLELEVDETVLAPARFPTTRSTKRAGRRPSRPSYRRLLKCFKNENLKEIAQ